LAAALAPGISGGARAATGSVVQAEGDAYAVAAVASLLGSGPTHQGPVSPALASVPPGTAQSSAPSLAKCSNGAGTGCADPLTTAVDVAQSNADAGIQGVTAHCDGAPAGIGGNTVVGGSACVTIASASTLNTGSPGKPADAVIGTGISAISQTQGCGGTASTGTVRIKSLVVNGTAVVGPDPVETTPAPNTVVPLGAVTVILNEQHYDAQGHGLTVNAVHVFSSADLGSLANVDLVIGHAHSEAMCDSGTVIMPPLNPNAGATPQSLPTGTKADSTKSANPGEVVTYTLTIAGNGCKVVSVVDMLPSGFQYVAGSAAGDLGPTPSVTQSPANAAVQQLEWYNPTGWPAAKLSETLKVKVPSSAVPGMYVNNVSGDSSPPMATATIACGAFVFSDTMPLDGPVAADNGTNPGVIVPRSGVAPAVAPANQPGVAPAAAEAGAAAAVGTPNTAGGPPAAVVATLFALAGLGAAALLGRRRARRSSG
jgi:uncharacterized repeat protein (TIGR01451 family)